jgi:hypothetical protein
MPAAGAFLVDGLTGAHAEIDFQGPDERMRAAFAAVGGDLPDEELDAIEAHRSVLYLLGDGGSLDKIRALVGIAVRLLPQGGLGIKVETAGVAAPLDRWMSLSQALNPFDLIRCFTIVGTTERGAYSCGMHNLGLEDASIEGVPPAEGARVLQKFNLYRLVESPTLRAGQTFALEKGAPAFVLDHRPCTEWPGDDLFFNPFGMWHLAPSGTQSRTKKRK